MPFIFYQVENYVKVINYNFYNYQGTIFVFLIFIAIFYDVLVVLIFYISYIILQFVITERNLMCQFIGFMYSTIFKLLFFFFILFSPLVFVYRLLIFYQFFILLVFFDLVNCNNISVDIYFFYISVNLNLYTVFILWIMLCFLEKVSCIKSLQIKRVKLPYFYFSFQVTVCAVLTAVFIWMKFFKIRNLLLFR